MKKHFIGLFLCFAVLFYASSSFAAPVFNSNNGHYYDIVTVPNYISWVDARDAAAVLTYGGLGGHLVTITSEAEKNWIDSIWPANQETWYDSNNPLWNHWLGAYQLPDQSAPDVGWQWVTGEAWEYTNWWTFGSGEPNDYAGETRGIEDNEENYAAFVPLNQWYDYGPWMGPGYVVEYSLPLNGNPVPEPATVLLLGAGLTGLVFRRRKE